MKSRSYPTIAAFFLVGAIVAPSVFLIGSSRAHAQAFDPISVPTGDFVTRLQTTISAITGPINTAANVAQKINTFYLQPLAFVLSGNLTKALTASVIGFVIGKANGTGIPQFVVDLKQTMQTVSDSAALAYLKQIGNTNSPFSHSISLALNTDYLQKSSLAGFWAANMDTLAAASPNVPAYLAGNWSQGGVAAWFSLTTQTQNNPFTLYENTQGQLANIIGAGTGGVTGVRASQLNWGQGFTSWCGATDTGNTAVSSGKAGTTASAASGAVVNPGDPCTTKDGNPGRIQTPGSVISATLNKVLGSQQDQIVRMGNLGPEINSVLANIATVVQTTKFAASILGGDSGSGGLLGSDQTTSTGRSLLGQFTPTQSSSGDFTSGYLGASQASILQQAAADPSSGSDKSSLVTRYENSWNAIAASTNTASTSVTSLINVCTTAAVAAQSNPSLRTFAAASSAQAAAAQTALANIIAPVSAQIAAASSVVANARAMIQQVQNDTNAVNSSAASTYSADLQTLQTMPPSATDVAAAEQQAKINGSAIASPSGSLDVSASSLVDQMNLISANAQTLETTVCSPPSSSYSSSGTRL